MKTAADDMVPDATKAEGGDALSVVLENDQVRVLRYRSKPGHTVAMHTHPGPQVYVALSDFKRRITRPDGSFRDIERKFGEVIWVSDPTPHEGKDIGDGTDLLIVEIKNPQWSQGNSSPN